MHSRRFTCARTLLKCAPLALALYAAAPASAQLQRAFTGILVDFYRGEPGPGLVITNGAKTETFFCLSKYVEQCFTWAGNCENFGRKVTVRYNPETLFMGEEGEDEVNINSVQGIEWSSAPLDRELNQALCEANGLKDNPDTAKINSLGEWYERGQRGLPRDMEKAEQYYQTAAEGGSAAAKRNLANLRSPKGAQQGSTASVAAAPAMAQQKTFTGTLIYMGGGSDGTYLEVANGTKTEVIYCSAHENQCDAWGCEKLGSKITVRYTCGGGFCEMQGVAWPSAPVDPELKQALCAGHNGGNAELINKLGEWFERGQRGLPKDVVHAQQYYEWAAENGSSAAKRNLANLCRRVKCLQSDEWD